MYEVPSSIPTTITETNRTQLDRTAYGKTKAEEAALLLLLT